jgi:mannitol-1-phosphate/altronate dehydrogenase
MPEGLTASLAALILTYRNPEFEIKDDPYILEVFQKEYPSTLAMVRTILSDEQIWSENLTKYPPFLDSVVTSLEDLNEHGSRQFVHSITEHYTLG